MSVCSWCKDKPVWNAASWISPPNTVPATLPCPRCGRVWTPEEIDEYVEPEVDDAA